MANHTPGPWTQGSKSTIVTKDAWRLNIALVALQDHPNNAPKTAEEAQANLALIAQAPEMKQALQDIVQAAGEAYCGLMTLEQLTNFIHERTAELWGEG